MNKNYFINQKTDVLYELAQNKIGSDVIDRSDIRGEHLLQPNRFFTAKPSFPNRKKLVKNSGLGM